jgi:hypothetical protein
MVAHQKSYRFQTRRRIKSELYLTTEIQIRKATADDITGMMHLFTSSIGISKSASFFQWWDKFPSITYCAIEDGKLAGMFVVLKRKLINNLNCGVLMGLLVNNEWRGKGLFKKLGDQAMNHFDDIDLFCCLPNEIGKRALEKQFNFKTISTIETMSLACNVNNDSSNYVSTPVTSNTKFTNFEKSKENTIMFLADEEFRQWRFASHHRYKYDVIRLDSNEFAITNKYFNKETNLVCGDIVDFETETLEENRLINLINCAYGGLKKDVNIITIQAIPNSLLYDVSKKIGFRESSAKHYFCIKVKKPANDYLYDSASWLIKWGDYLR